MGFPKEPRQQMINMMYLVLTALLALNVSAEILKAFVLVNDGITETIQAISSKNAVTYGLLANHSNPEKARDALQKSQLAKKYADQLFKDIDALKEEIITKSGGRDEHGQPDGAKDLNIPSEILIFNKKGDELQNKIIETRKKLLALINPKDQPIYAKQLTLKADAPKPDPEHGTRTWAEANFQSTPVIASIVMLTKFQNDTRNAEADVVDYLLNSVGATDIRVDRLKAVILQNSNYVMQGQEYDANIFVSAYSSTQQPEVFLGVDSATASKPGFKGTPLPIKDGMANYKVQASGEGERTYGGVVRLLDPTGEYKVYPFKGEYMVAKPSAVVSPDKMNVFYIGVDNPVSVSAAGVPAENISVSMSNGSISGSKGKYNVRVSEPGIAKVSVSAKFANGVKAIGTPWEFRVKRIPPPIAKIAGSPGGNLSSSVIKVQKGPAAILENFDFDVKFNIVSFDMIFVGRRQDPIQVNVQGSTFNDEVKTVLNRAKPGDTVYFENIKARGPDGRVQTLAPIVFKLN